MSLLQYAMQRNARILWVLAGSLPVVFGIAGENYYIGIAIAWIALVLLFLIKFEIHEDTPICNAKECQDIMDFDGKSTRSIWNSRRELLYRHSHCMDRFSFIISDKVRDSYSLPVAALIYLLTLVFI